jgi:hypothetical protein
MLIQYRSKNLDKDTNLDDSLHVKQRLVTIEPKDLIGRTFQLGSEEDGQRFQACFVCTVVDKEEGLTKKVE